MATFSRLRQLVRPRAPKGNRPVDVLATDGARLREVVVAHTAVNGAMMTNFGGLFARRLVAEGAELHFFASGDPVFGNAPPVEEFAAIGSQFHALPVPQHLAPLRDLLTLGALILHLRRLHVDVIHTRGTVMGVLGRVAGQMAGVPVILHHQDDLYCREGAIGPLTRKAVALFERALSELTDRSFFVSQAVLDDALAMGFDPHRSILVGHDLNPIFEPLVAPGDPRIERVRRRFDAIGVPRGVPIVGCVARLAPIKGIDVLVEAAALVVADPAASGWVFVVRGDGPMLASLEARVAEKGLKGRFFFLTEELPLEELPALFKCFGLFALPTRREGFGMVFAEAMAMRVPVVGPRIAPVTEVVPEGCGVLVGAEDPAALADALRALMEDPARREQLAQAGEAHIRSTMCGSARAAERVLGAYLAVLAEKAIIRQEG